MVIKKKKSYKKQKGGLVIPKQILDYFDSIKYLINMFYEQIDLRDLPNSFERKEDLKINIETWIRSNNIYLRNLAIKIDKILKEKNNINTVKRYQDLILEILKCALLEVFFSLPTNKSKLTFPDILKKIFINILFIDYLNLDIQAKNKNVLNETIQEKIMKLLNILFHITSLDDKKYLIGLLRTLFLEDYQNIYGIPVFYGNMSDSYHNLTRNLGYNQFICEKVGISSKEKRNYIINPVGALAWMYIDKQNYKNTPLYDLLRKILRFDYVQGNKRQGSFEELPKLAHLRQSKSKFCIAINPVNNEEVYQEPTNDVSMCSKLYGCSLKMTAEIRPENIASNEDILELLSILVIMELDEPIPQNSRNMRRIPIVNISSIHNNPLPPRVRRQVQPINNSEINKLQKQQREINNRARYFRNFSLYNNISPPVLLKDKDYNTILDKLYREAYKLINNTILMITDIPKIKRLLEIIKEIKFGPNKSKMHNINEDVRQDLIKRLRILEPLTKRNQ